MRFGRVIFTYFGIVIFILGFFSVPRVFAAAGTSSMVGYWKLDEGTAGSSIVDTSGYGNTGSAHGTGSGPTPSTDVTYTTFPDSHSATFNGSDQYIEVADNSSLDATSAVTISAWIKLASSDASYHTIAGKWYTGTHQQYLIQVNSDGKIGFWTGDGNTCADDLESTNTLAAGSWIHIVGVQSGTTKRLYINGTQDTTKTSTCSLGSSTALFGIGSKYNNAASYFEFFNGKIDEVRVYSRALSSTEISDLAHGNHTSATWTGSSSTNFETAGNWNVNTIPEPYTKFVIANTTNHPALSINEQFGGVTINSGGYLDLAGFNLTMNDYLSGNSGLATNSGTIISKNSETLSNFILPTNTGTVMFTNTVDATGLLFGNTYNNLIFNDSLLGYWKLDESSGNAIDSSGFGATLTNSNVTYVAGKFNNAGSFNGTNSGFSGTGPNLANNTFTISAWLYATNLNADQTWFNLGSSSSNDKALHLRLTSEGALHMGFFFDDLDTADAIFSTNTWHQVIYTYNSSTHARAIYLDGVQKASGNASANFSGNTSMTIGSWQGAERWNGYIDDVRVFNRVLSSTEIANLAAANPPAASIAITTLNHDLTVNGNLLLNSGTLDVSSSNYTIIDTGNFDNNGGVFTARSGTVTLTGTNQAINGGNTFYNLTKNVSSADTLTLPTGYTSTISATLTLSGASGNLLALRSSSPSAQFTIDPQGTRMLSYLNPQDANNVNATAIAYNNTFTYGANLTNWITNNVTPTPTSSSSDSSNTSSSNSYIPSCQNLPSIGAPTIFATNMTPTSITLDFTPVDATTRTYYLYYGTEKNATSYATSYLFVNPTGVGRYTIHNLSENTLYYFKIQAGNGCAPGPFSRIVSVRTGSSIITQNIGLAQQLENTPITKPLTITKSNLTATTPTPTFPPTEASGYSLNVVVTDTHGNPVTGATVTLHSKVQEAITDGKGIAHFVNVEQGSHTVMLAYNGYSGQKSLTVTGAKKALTFTLQVQLNSGVPLGVFAGIVGVLVIIIGILIFLLLKSNKRIFTSLT